MKLPDNELRYVLPIAALLAVVVLWVNVAHSTEGFSCGPPVIQDNPSWQLTTCWADPHTKYVRDDADFPYPTAWMQKRNGSTRGDVFAQFDGWGYSEIHNSGADNFDITVQQVYSHYAPNPPGPGLAWPLTYSQGRDWDWGGPLHGKNANGERLAATLDKIAATGYRIDAINLGGNCWGGAAVLTQSVIMPERWQQKISAVYALLPGMTAEQGIYPGYPSGMYWRRNTGWDSPDGTKYDITLAQHSKHLDKLQNIYYRIQGASFPTDEIGFDQGFFSSVCDKGHIYCYAQWGDQSHAWPDPKSPPAYQVIQNAAYAGPDMQWELDKAKIVPTHSSANHYGPRGHYNQGIAWRTGGVIDSPEQFVAPIRYVAVKDMGNGLPDQPDTVTLNLHIRPINMDLPQWTLVDWAYRDQSGQALVTKTGEVSIRGLVLQSNAAYSDLTFTNVGILPGF